jgi:acyl carrier protein
MLIMMEEDYGVKISVDEFLKLNTLGEIYAKIKQ